MRGRFHGKHDLAFDAGEFPDLLHQEVITRTIVADGKGPINGLPLRCNNAHFMIALGNIDTYDKHSAHLETYLQTILTFL